VPSLTIRIYGCCTIALILVCLSHSGLLADAAGDLHERSEEQRVVEYLKDHPEFLLDHPELLQRTFELRQETRRRAETERRRFLINEKEDSLFLSKLTPARGDAAAPHTLIEFSDYQCIPCKRSFPSVEAFIQERSNIRLIHLPLPIYGPQSIMAARAALIAQSAGDFEKFHRAMMQSTIPVDLHAIESALAFAGVSAEEFSDRMADPELSDYLMEVKEFSIALNVIGTPAFLLDGILINGAVNEKNLNDVMTQLMEERE
jgi:protein-disulfide isomerase